MLLCGALLAVGAMWLATSAVFLVPPRHAANEVARTACRQLRSAASDWQESHARVCPTPARLRDDGAIDRNAKLTDPWGNPFRMTCTGDAIVVRSAGPDGVFGTKDDIED